MYIYIYLRGGSSDTSLRLRVAGDVRTPAGRKPSATFRESKFRRSGYIDRRCHSSGGVYLNTGVAFLACAVCNKPVSLETANVDEDGQPVHEQCYLLKIQREQIVRSRKAEQYS